MAHCYRPIWRSISGFVLLLSLLFLGCADYPPVNSAPISKDDSYDAFEDTELVVAAEEGLLANDTDSDGNPLTISLTGTLSTDKGGTMELDVEGGFTYTPASNFFGTDTISYTVTDSQHAQSTGTVTINVSPSDDPPAAFDDAKTIDEDNTVVIHVLENDVEVDGENLTIVDVTAPSNGEVTDNGDGTITYTPATNYYGADSFEYSISDESGGLSDAAVYIDITAVNDAPSCTTDGYRVSEDTSLEIEAEEGVLANDLDVEQDSFEVTSTGSLTTTNDGNVVLNADGSFSYTPSSNFFGKDEFSYLVADVHGASATGIASISVGEVNDVPIANADELALPEDTPTSFDPTANDIDGDGDDLTITETSIPKLGSVTLNVDNTVMYNPHPNIFGEDSFTYKIIDGYGGEAQGTVTVTIASVNDVPVATADTLEIDEDEPGVVAVLNNDSDVENDPLQVTEVVGALNGTPTIQADNTVAYTPNADYNGTDSFTYTVIDGNGGSTTANVEVTIEPVNDAPVAENDSATMEEDTQITLLVLDNDTDVDNDTLTIPWVSNPPHGTAEIISGTSIRYTPDKDYDSSDSFYYRVSDGNGGNDYGTVSIQVTGENDPPDAVNDYVATDEDTPITIRVLDNDLDVDDDDLKIEWVTDNDDIANGSVEVINNDTRIRFTPDPEYYGRVTFYYRINDGHGETDTARVRVTVNSVNDPPEAQNDSATTEEDTAVTIAVLDNDSDPDGDDLEVDRIANAPDHGTAVIVSNTRIRYTPDENYFGGDSFTYVVSDGNGGEATAMVTVTVTAVNDDPVAQNDTGVTIEETSVDINVVNNDSDPDGDDLAVDRIGNSPDDGTAVIITDTTIRYTPDEDYSGNDSFTYVVSDGNGGEATATVYVTISNTNDDPIAQNDSASTDDGIAVEIDVLDNDSDPEDDNLNIISVSNPPNGSAGINNGNPDTVTYTPDAGFSGSDSFTYTISDGNGGEATATVSITVNLVNVSPSAEDDSATTAENTSTDINVLANDSDDDGDSFGLTYVSDPPNGTAEIKGDVITYTPDADVSGSDSFSYTIADIHGATDSATVTVTITPAVFENSDSKSIAVSDTYTLLEDEVLTVDSGNGVRQNDAEEYLGDYTLIEEQQGASRHGGYFALMADGGFEYIPPPNFTGTDSFAYYLEEAGGNGISFGARVRLQVLAVNDPPAAQNDHYWVMSGGEIEIPADRGVLANDFDPDENTLSIDAPFHIRTELGGWVTMETDGGFAYWPPPAMEGQDRFSYRVSDGQALSEAEVTVVVHGNQPPELTCEAYFMTEDHVTTVDAREGLLVTVLEKDSDGIEIEEEATVTTTFGGIVTLAQDGSFAYQPSANFYGQDGFAYTVTDGHHRVLGLARLTVTESDDAPDVIDEAYFSATDTVLDVAGTYGLLANDVDADGETLAISSPGIVITDSGGIVRLNGDGGFRYEPPAGFSGLDAFDYMVCDPEGLTTSGTVWLVVD
jgi:hypothetical protein